MRQILVTSALPYANGHIHLGHLVEYIQTDIWVRFQRLVGNRCVFVCADDTHGTAISIRAKQEGRSEEAVIADMKAAHERDFAGFSVSFDNYGSTNSPSNRALCNELWQKIRAAGLVVEKSVTQLFDPVAKQFLADRYVRGNCPKCGAPDQYGDSCDKCGAAYSPTDLTNPVSALSGATPELQSSPHWFINTEQMHDFLATWTRSGALHEDVANWLAGAFLAEPLRDWDVSRPAPYFGFEIPDAPGNYWYVWFDAPIGYMASTKDWCDRVGEKFDDWWRSDQTEIHHFIGKDITYFHTLFWPVMLKAAGFTLPKAVHIHGFLTVNGEKMSKSKGTFIRAATYLQSGLDPHYLRYFYASKLTPKLDNLDLGLEDFVAKVNGDLVGKVVNLASRTAKFVRETGLAAVYPDDGGLFAEAAAEGTAIAEAYEACDYNQAMRRIMALADRANKFVDERAPWTLKKDPSKAAELQQVCTVALNLFRQLVVYLAPVMPRLAEQTGELLSSPIGSWNETQQPLVGTAVNEYKHLLSRVDMKQVEAMVEASRESAPSNEPAASTPAAGGAGTWNDDRSALDAEPLVADRITIDQFTAVDLRVARVIEAKEVPEAKKLLQLTLLLGGDEKRNVFAGIKAAYKPEDLVGRLVVMVANLEPRQMKFGLSEGMVTAAGPGGPEVFLLGVDSGAKPGQRVH
ncbi:MAG: methionine--tRNA ligase [Planctomycetaceae bacterium]|nr:methionine--tRNA ligase [Planctomycetaceae bacterium]